MNKSPQSGLKSLGKAQVSALIATVVDFGVTYVGVEWCTLHYVVSVASGALSGAVTNFLLNRYWTFESVEKSILTQGTRYFLVAAGSLLINTLGVYLLTELMSLHYLISKLAVSIAVSLFYNYPLHRGFVYEARYDEPNPTEKSKS